MVSSALSIQSRNNRYTLISYIYNNSYVLDFESAVITRYKEDYAEWDDFFEWETWGLVKRDNHAKKIL